MSSSTPSRGRAAASIPPAERRAFCVAAKDALERRLLDLGAPPVARRRPDHVLLDALTVEQARRALDDVAEGGGGELRIAKRGSPPFCSPDSSAALAVNCFAPFIGRAEADTNLLLTIADPRFERRFPVNGVTARGVPTLDVVLRQRESRAVLIESKLLEPWRGRPRVEFHRQYDGVAQRISEGTVETLRALRGRRLSYEALDAAQLMKHLFGIHSAIANGELPDESTLALLHWEPSSTAGHDTLFSQLDAEFADFRERLADQPVALTSISYQRLWQEWRDPGQREWLRKHAEALIDRYDIAL